MKKFIWPAITIVCLIVVAFSIRGCINSNKDNRSLQDALKISRDSVVHFKNERGQLVSQSKQMLITIDQLKENGDQLGINVKQLTQQVGSLKNLVAYYKGKIEISGSGATVATDTVIKFVNGEREDSVKAKKFTFDNSHLRLNGFYNPINDNVQFDYKYSIGFEYTSYWKRLKPFTVKQLFNQKANPKNLVLEMKFDDPSAIVSQATTVTIAPSHKKWYETTGAKIGAGILIGGVGVYKLSR